MTNTYCILEKENKIKVSKLGFSWLAFFFSPVWALIHSLWKEFTIWFLFVSISYLLSKKLGEEVFYLSLFLSSFIWGLFGRDFKIQDYITCGYIPVEFINSSSGKNALLTYLSKK